MENENITPLVEEPVIEKPVVPQVPSVSPEPEKKSNFFKILIVFIGILIAFGLFANAYLMFSKKETALKTSDSSLMVTPTPIIDQTANWKTYKDKDLTFRYPTEWNMEPSGGQELARFTIQGETIGGENTLNLYLTDNYNQDTKKPFSSLEEVIEWQDGNLKTFKELVVDSQRALWVKDQRSGHVPNETVSLFSPNKKSIFTFFFYYQQGESATEQKIHPLFDQILSTFKFTDQQEIPSAISSLFNKINKDLGTKISPVFVSGDNFFSNGKYSIKNVWQLNLNQFYTDKTKITQIINTIEQFQLKDSGGSGESDDRFINTYENSDMDCTLLGVDSIFGSKAILKLSCAVK